MTDPQDFTPSSSEGSPIEEVLEDYRRGKMVIVVDDEDRVIGLLDVQDLSRARIF